jgi:hypothetical protein
MAHGGRRRAEQASTAREEAATTAGVTGTPVALVMVMRLRLLAFATIASACGSDPHTMPDSATAVDAAMDIPIDARRVTPWTAPTGMALSGVTFADGWGDLRALSAPLVIPGGWTDSLFAQPDGKHLLFAYEQVDFSTLFLTNGAMQPLTGPMLAGLSPATFEIFDAELGQADWIITPHPIDLLAPGAVVASPATNAAGDLLIFTEFTLPSGRSQLFYSQRTGTTWSAPDHLAFNSASCHDDNAKIVGDLATSVTIYFESDRGNDAGTGTTCGQRTIYTTTYSAGTFSPVTRVPGIATADSDDTQPFPTANGLVWTSGRSVGGYGVFVATKQGGTYTSTHPIAKPTQTGSFVNNVVLLGEASIVEQPEGDLLYMMCGLATNVANGMTYGDADHIQLIPCVARRPH